MYKLYLNVGQLKRKHEEPWIHWQLPSQDTQEIWSLFRPDLL